MVLQMQHEKEHNYSARWMRNTIQRLQNCMHKLRTRIPSTLVPNHLQYLSHPHNTTSQVLSTDLHPTYYNSLT